MKVANGQQYVKAICELYCSSVTGIVLEQMGDVQAFIALLRPNVVIVLQGGAIDSVSMHIISGGSDIHILITALRCSRLIHVVLECVYIHTLTNAQTTIQSPTTTLYNMYIANIYPPDL